VKLVYPRETKFHNPSAIWISIFFASALKKRDVFSGFLRCDQVFVQQSAEFLFVEVEVLDIAPNSEFGAEFARQGRVLFFRSPSN
jgi:hypothetical protein